MISHDSVIALQRHLAEAMGVEVHWEKSGLGDRLPMALRSQYLVKVASLLGHQCAFLIRIGGDAVSAETIAKHLAVVRGKWSEARPMANRAIGLLGVFIRLCYMLPVIHVMDSGK